MVPVAPLGETVAVSVTDVPETADVEEAVTVVVVDPVVLALLVPDPPPQPKGRRGAEANRMAAERKYLASGVLRRRQLGGILHLSKYLSMFCVYLDAAFVKQDYATAPKIFDGLRRS